MPKEFITERDIEDMVRAGRTSLQLSDNLVLTELAYEKAHQLGMQLIAENVKPPSAPERPYIAKQVAPPAAAPAAKPQEDVRARIRSAVTAKLGSQVDPALLDSIINRVVETLGGK